jgi:phenylalanyl-tRNA synthetase alpha chain
MKTRKPPVRLLIPGRVFRNEATDATHETHFYQLEGFVIDEGISLAHLKGVLSEFVAHMYGSDTKVKFIPAYFPFVEPGIEMYIQLNGRWLEMGGAGMIHPEVIKNMGLNPDKYQGFAFGWGIDRLVMLAHGIDDIRYLYNGSLRFLHQFQEVA